MAGVLPEVFLGLSAAGLLLTVNALRPLATGPLGVPVFFAGWLAVELAPHNLVIVVLGTLAFALAGAVEGAVGWAALGCSAATVVGLLILIVQSQRARGVVDAALVDGLGEGYASPLLDRPVHADLRTPWRQLVRPFRMRHPDVERTSDIPYAEGAGRRHLLDVYCRRGRPPGAPVLVQIHGGAWIIGRKEQQGLPLMQHLAARGWVCVAPNYRLAPRTRMPEMLVDLKRALAWVREHAAEYGGDPDTIVVTGGSAGGHLAALLALTAGDPRYQPGFEDVDTRVRACIPHYGVYDITAEGGHRESRRTRDKLLARMVIGVPFESNEDRYRAMSPVCQVAADAPAFFVIHGRHDTLVPVAEARLFVGRLRAASSAPVVYAELPGAQHAFDIFPSIRSAHVVRAIERFLAAVVGRGQHSGVSHTGADAGAGWRPARDSES